MSERKPGPFLESDGDDQIVGFQGEPPPDGFHRYFGPVARISHDKDWLHIVTDSYEGHAMLNIETLPKLRRALSNISRKLKRKPEGR